MVGSACVCVCVCVCVMLGVYVCGGGVCVWVCVCVCVVTGCYPTLALTSNRVVFPVLART